MIANDLFNTCPDEIIGNILSFLPLTRGTLESRTISSKFQQIFDNSKYVPEICALLEKVKKLKETTAILKEIQFDKGDLPFLEKIEEKTSIPALVLTGNACTLPVLNFIWNTPYIYPLALLYKIVDLAIYSPAYHIGAITGTLGIMLTTAWATSKLFIYLEKLKIEELKKMHNEAKTLKHYVEGILR